MLYLLSNGQRITNGVPVSVDLSDYYTKEEINGLLSGYVTTDNFNTLVDQVNGLDALGDLVMEFDDETHELSWYKNGDATPIGSVVITGTGGGSGGTGITMKMVYNGASSQNVLLGDKNTSVSFSWSSVYTDGGETTGNGSIQVKVNGLRVGEDTNVAQGLYTYNVADSLGRGSNQVQVILTDNAGNVRNLRWSITVVSLELTSTFNSYQAFYSPNPITFTYTASTGGSIEKTVHFDLDGQVDWSTVTNTSSGGISTLVIPASALSHGTHSLKVYMTAKMADGTNLTSNILYYEMAYIVNGYGAPVVVSNFSQTEAYQFDNISIPYMIWDPNYIPGTSTSTSHNRHCRLAVFNPNLNDGQGGWDQTLAKEINPDRSVQYWTLRLKETGAFRLRIYANDNVYKEFNLQINSLNLNIENIENSLEAEFTATGRSNSEANYSTWQSITTEGGTITAQFPEDFDWINGGWQTDENGATVMRIKASDNKVTIPLKLFQNDFKGTGKSIKIIFRCRNSINYESQILSCYSGNIGLRLYANNAIFNSLGKELQVPYKEDSYLEMDIVVYPSSGNPNSLIMYYINSIPSAVTTYEPGSDRFSQTTPVDISLGSSECDVDIYLIKTYNRALNQWEILNNFITDAPSADEMITRYQRNDIFDEPIYEPTHKVDLTKLKTKYMIIESDESQYPFYFPTTKLKDIKNPPTKVNITYVDPDNSARNFTSKNVGLGIQGTSSVGYASAAMNLNISFDVDGFNYSESGTKADRFAMRSNSIPVNFFCLKADVASSESANNVLLTDEYNLYDPYTSDPQLDELLDMAAAAGYTPTHDRKTDRDGLVTELKNQGFKNKIRGTIEGQPIIVFHRDTSGVKNDGELAFYGKFNMNNDKTNYDVFGQDRSKYPHQCCLEFLTNESPLCSFKSDDFYTEVGGQANWETGFEFRFPKKGYTDEDIENLHKVVSWVVSTDTEQATNAPLATPVTYGGTTYSYDNADYRLAKFKYEFEDHFILDSAIWLYLFTERHEMVDNRAKNVFMSTDDGIHWHFKNDYDNDTALGIDNIGRLVNPYGLEYRDGSGSYGGESSVLWINLARCFPDEIQAMAVAKEAEGAFAYERIRDKFNTYQDSWPEAIWVLDMFQKYIRPYTTGNDSTYLSMMLGSKEFQRDWFLYYQSKYMSSKYIGPTATTDDEIQMRITVPGADAGSSIGIVPPNQTLTITPYSDMYVLVKYGNGAWQQKKAKKGEPVVINPASFTETGSGGAETYIGNASLLTDIGDLSPLYLSMLDISKAKKLQVIKVGNTKPGYKNGSWPANSNIDFNSTLIKTIILTGLTNLNAQINIANCTNIEDFEAENTSIPSVRLAQNSNIRTLKLPATITSLALQYLNHLTTLSLQGEDNLSSLIAEVLPDAVDALIPNIVQKATNLQSVRLIDIYWNLKDKGNTGTEILQLLEKTAGLDSSGNIASSKSAPNRYVTGSFIVGTINDEDLSAARRKFPNLSILYDTQMFTLTFQNWDGTILGTQTVARGGDGHDPITAGEIQTPTKESDAQFNYKYSSWDKSYMGVTENRTLTALYNNALRHYNVFFYKNTYEQMLANPKGYTPYYSVTGNEEGTDSTAVAYGSDIDMSKVPDPLAGQSGTWLRGGWTIVQKPGWRKDNTSNLPDDFKDLDTIESTSVSDVEGTTFCFAVADKVQLPSVATEFQSCTWGEIKAVLNAAKAKKLKLNDWWELGQYKTIKLNNGQSVNIVIVDMDVNNGKIVMFPNMTSLEARQMNATKKASYYYSIDGVDATEQVFSYTYTGSNTSIQLKPSYDEGGGRTGRPLLVKITNGSKVYNFASSTFPTGLTVTGTHTYNAAGFTELGDDCVITIPVAKGDTIQVQTFLNGNSWNNGGWYYSDLRKYANEKYFYLLPGLVQALIVSEARKNTIGNYVSQVSYTYNGAPASSINVEALDTFDPSLLKKTETLANSKEIYITSYDKVYLLNDAEISALAANAANFPVYAKEGNTLKVFIDNDSRIRRRPAEAFNPDNQFYWLSTTYVDYNNGFGAVDKDGKWNQGYPAYSYFPCAFAFTLGAD